MNTEIPATRPELMTNQASPRPCIGRQIARFFIQLRERKVCRAAAAYALATWLMLQLGEIVFPALDLPDWTLTLVVVLAAIGFPVAMVLAWALQWTNEGLVLDAPEDNPVRKSPPIQKALDVAMLLVAAVLSIQLVWSRAGAGITEPTRAFLTPTLMIQPFSFQTAETRMQIHGLEDEIRHLLLRHEARPVEVIAGGETEVGFAHAGEPVAIRWVLRGTVYDQGKRVRVLLQLIDMRTQRYVWSVSLDSDDGRFPGVRESFARRAIAALLAEASLPIGPIGPVSSHGEIPAKNDAQGPRRFSGLAAAYEDG